MGLEINTRRVTLDAVEPGSPGRGTGARWNWGGTEMDELGRTLGGTGIYELGGTEIYELGGARWNWDR